MMPTAFVSALPDTPLCSCCRKAPGGRVLQSRYGRRSYCARCVRMAGTDEDAQVREMAGTLIEAVGTGLDLKDWFRVRALLTAHDWTEPAIMALADKALGVAGREIGTRAQLRAAAAHAGTAAAVLFASVSLTAVGCFLPPIAHAAVRMGAQPGGFWAELIPLGVVVLIVVSLIACVVSRGRKMPADPADEAIGDTTNWSRPR